MPPKLHITESVSQFCRLDILVLRSYIIKFLTINTGRLIIALMTHSQSNSRFFLFLVLFTLTSTRYDKQIIFEQVTKSSLIHSFKRKSGHKSIPLNLCKLCFVCFCLCTTNKLRKCKFDKFRFLRIELFHNISKFAPFFWFFLFTFQNDFINL